MGNAPSKDVHGRSAGKLSKPRITASSTTTTPATAALLSPHGHSSAASPAPPHDPATDLISIPYSATATAVSPADDDTAGDGRAAQQDATGSTTLGPPKPQRRLSLFRSKSSQETPDRRRFRRNTIIGSPTVSSPSPSQDSAPERAASVSTPPVVSTSPNGLSITQNRPPLGNRPTSWAYDLKSYEAQRILSLVQESPPPLPRSQTLSPLAEGRRGETQTSTWRRASIAVHPESAPISRSNSEISLHPPMRRRSMIQTPGVATRTRPGPVAASSTRASLRHSHPPTPSMSRKSSFELSFEGRDHRLASLPPLHPPLLSGEVPRVHTPKETDYSTTGAFKFGTLRITNGSPTLTPISAAGGGPDFKSKPASRSRDYFGLQPPQSDSTRRTESTSSQFSGQLTGLQISDVKRTTSADQAALLVHSINIPDMRLGGQDMSDFQAGLDEIPEKRPASPLLEIQSRQAAVDDHLFEDDDHPEISSVEVLDIRLDPSAKRLPSQPIDPTQTAAGDFMRSDSGFASETTPSPPEAGNSLAKADSGYSSNVSLRSLRNGRKTSKKGKEVGRTSRDSEREPQETRGTGSQNMAGTQVETPQSDKAPTPPPKDELLVKPTTQPTCRTAEAGGEQATSPAVIRRKPVRQPPPAIDTSQTEDRKSVKSPESVPRTPVSVKSEESASSLSISNSTQRPGRLQRLLSMKKSSSSKQQYTVHETHPVNNKVPSIPKEVEDKLREHTGLFPMTNKRLALKSQMSKETLKTILSVGSLELTKEDELRPTSAFLDVESEDEALEVESNDAREKSLKQTFNSMQSNFKNAAASMMANRKPVARKPLPIQKESSGRSPASIVTEEHILSLEAELTSYSSVNSSLGSNAFDAAQAALKSPSRPDRSLSLTVGHTGHDQSKQRRSYSLHTTPPRAQGDVPSQVTSASREGQSSAKRNSSPPVSMTTRGTFRRPPPRSPLSPKGPAVLRKENHSNNPGRKTGPSSSDSDGPKDHRVSLDGVSQTRPGADNHQQMKTHNYLTRHISLGSQRTTVAVSRHTSMSSVQSDALRASRSFQLHEQQHQSDSSLKQHSSVESLSVSQLHELNMPRAPHQGPAAGYTGQFDLSNGHWSPQHTSHPADTGLHPGQFAWVPPYVPRGHHRRNLSAGSQPQHHRAGENPAPYRILHSYNSPAYRNAPIWG